MLPISVSFISWRNLKSERPLGRATSVTEIGRKAALVEFGLVDSSRTAAPVSRPRSSMNRSHEGGDC